MQNPCGIGFLEKEFKSKRWVLPSKAFHGAVVVGLRRPWSLYMAILGLTCFSQKPSAEEVENKSTKTNRKGDTNSSTLGMWMQKHLSGKDKHCIPDCLLIFWIHNCNFRKVSHQAPDLENLGYSSRNRFKELIHHENDDARL